MKNSIKFLFISLMLMLLCSCTETKDPLLPGKRVNVLHYDLLENEKQTKVKINIPAQSNLDVWKISDVGQFTGLPANYMLDKDIKKQTSFHPNNFSPSIPQDSSIIIIDNIIYSYSDTILSAYNIDTKKSIWSASPVNKNERTDVLGGGIAYHNNVIYLSSGARDFIAFDATTGYELWRTRMPNVVRNIALIYNDQIYVTSIDNKLSCYSLEGNLLWRYNAAIYSIISSRIYISSLVYQDKLITITTAGDLVILSRFGGEEMTEVNLSTEAIIGDGSIAKGAIASPLLDNQYLYILTGENEFLKLDLLNSIIVWRQYLSSAKSFWVAGNTSYLLTEDSQLLAVENEQGKPIWIENLSVHFKENKDRIFYGPIMAGDNLIITADNGEFILVSPDDGKLISRHKNGFSVNRMPIIVNKKLYFISSSGKVAVWE